MQNFKDKANFIWSVADLLRGAYKQADYGKVILPLTVMRRLDQILMPTKGKVLEAFQANKKAPEEVPEATLNRMAKQKFHNRSKFDFRALVQDHNNIAANLRNYINGFSSLAKEIIERFEFEKQIHRLEEHDLLYMIVQRFAELDLSDTDAIGMGYI